MLHAPNVVRTTSLDGFKGGLDKFMEDCSVIILKMTEFYLQVYQQHTSELLVEGELSVPLLLVSFPEAAGGVTIRNRMLASHSPLWPEENSFYVLLFSCGLLQFSGFSNVFMHALVPSSTKTGVRNRTCFFNLKTEF